MPPTRCSRVGAPDQSTFKSWRDVSRESNPLPVSEGRFASRFAQVIRRGPGSPPHRRRPLFYAGTVNEGTTSPPARTLRMPCPARSCPA
jgi:hypothetical protein